MLHFIFKSLRYYIPQAIAFKNILVPGGLIKKIYKLFGKDIIMNYNYDGIRGKESFKELKNINNLLFGKVN